MTPEQHARAKQLFLAACERAQEDRPAFLQEACAGDGELRLQVEQLLRHHVEEAPATTVGESGAALQDSAPADGPPRLQTGALVSERYRVVQLLGRGGMGEVYQAEDLVLGGMVALKFLPRDAHQSAGWIKQLVAEARMARAVTNPHVCRIYDIHIDDAAGELYISMEFIDGEDLASLLRRIGRIPEGKGLEIAGQMCVALAAAHSRGILHRDLKPSNIMIDGQGRARVLDFGIATARSSRALELLPSGTPAFMAPELFAGTRASIQSDLYAFGLVLYELFTGVPPFVAESFTEYSRLHQRGSVSPPQERVPELTAEVQRAIQHCLAKDPADRPVSALALAAELPGSDALSVAMAAGITPPRTLVAQARTGGALRGRTTIALLAALITSVFVVVALSPRAGFMPGLDAAKAPAFLAGRAQALAAELAPLIPPGRQAFGFLMQGAGEFLNQAGRGAARSWLRWHLPVFWYRSSPAPLTPAGALNISFGHARTTLGDPRRDQPGSLAVVLGARGDLQAFEAVPPIGRAGGDAASFDWRPFFTAAGLDMAALTPTTPTLTDRCGGLAQQAWISPDSEPSDRRLRVEAAARGGHATLFVVLREPARQTIPWHADERWRRTAAAYGRFALVIAACFGVIPLAWRHLRQGRGDRQGALRLAAVAFVGRLLMWALLADHAADLAAESYLLLFALMRAWVEATLVWLFYTALEPYVRRFWPQSIVAWSRLISGRFQDALIGRDVLLGALLGVGVVVVFQLDRVTLSALGWFVREPLHLFLEVDALLGPWHTLGAIIDTLLASVYLALILIVMLVISRLVLKRMWLATVLTGALTFLAFLPGVANPAASWAPLGVVVAVLLAAAARFGLIVLVSAIFVVRLFTQLPLSFVSGTPGWDVAMLVLAVVAALAVYATWSSRRAPGRPDHILDR